VSVGRALARGRAAHRALMRDTVVIARVVGQTTDPVTGVVSTAYATVYTGPADVKLPPSLETQKALAGDRRVELSRYDVTLPFHTAVDFAPLDVVRVVASEDPHLVDRTLVVVSVGYSARRTARHLSCEDQEVSGG